VERATDVNQDVRPKIIELISKRGEAAKDAVQHLIQLLEESGDFGTRRGAAAALGQIGRAAEDALPELIGLATARGPLVGDWLLAGKAREAVEQIVRSCRQIVFPTGERQALDDQPLARRSTTRLPEFPASPYVEPEA
jgi:hypothetical protein